MHHSLLFQNVKTKLPSFSDINFNANTLKGQNCACTRFKRILKYSMKGFNLNDFEKEREIALKLQRTIVGNENCCNYCEQKIFRDIIIINGENINCSDISI